MFGILNFAQVDSAYVHYPKQVQPARALRTPGVYFKWYTTYPDAASFGAQEIAEAHTVVTDAIATGQLQVRDEVGFVIQHRCTGVDILYVCSWRGNNEVWETLFHKVAGPSAKYKLHERENTSATFCVWVLPTVMHEQRAWVRYLCSPRDHAAQQAYLQDQLTSLE